MRYLILVFTGLLLAACQGEDSTSGSAESAVASNTQADFQVYKSPTCGCCGDWIDHLSDAGFSSGTHHPDDMGGLKAELGIEPRYQSCHTAVSQQGYVFEGHVPASVIEDFLAAPPADALGLAVPGMPVGSPGMEMGDRFDPYDVLLLKRDGSSEVYRHIASADQQ